MNCPTGAPSSRFSKRAATGTRVPANTQAPLTRSGSRSTAAQENQLIMGQMVALALGSRMMFDGKALPGVPPTGAGVSSAKINLSQDGVRPISAEFNGEKITGRTWPMAKGHLVVLELTY